MGVQESLLVWWHLPVSLQPAAIISSPQTRPCRSLVTYPTDHINKVWQERCNLGVGLQVLESNLKQKGPCCPGPSTPSINWYLFKGKLGIYVLTF